MHLAHLPKGLLNFSERLLRLPYLLNDFLCFSNPLKRPLRLPYLLQRFLHFAYFVKRFLLFLYLLSMI
ncbi:MAG: hypothetical protein M3316_00320 [Actinomycetota bacterium]|nr:hypothetical protein [Actinomycetota bacterium]